MDLEKEIVIIGVFSCIEIWSKLEWDDVFNEVEEFFVDLVENMIGFDI